jgi:hypothetical protein
MTKKTLITPSLIAQAKSNIKLGFSYTALAASLNISDDTLYSWFRKAKDPATKNPIYSQFYAAVKEGEAELLTECLTSVKASMKSDVKAAFFMLERRFSSDFARKESLQVDQNTKSVNVNINAEVTADEKRALITGFLSKIQPKGRIMLPSEE